MSAASLDIFTIKCIINNVIILKYDRKNTKNY